MFMLTRSSERIFNPMRCIGIIYAFVNIVYVYIYIKSRKIILLNCFCNRNNLELYFKKESRFMQRERVKTKDCRLKAPALTMFLGLTMIGDICFSRL